MHFASNHMINNNLKEKIEKFKKKLLDLNNQNEIIEKNIFLNIFFFPKNHPEYFAKYKKINRSYAYLISLIFYNIFLSIKDLLKIILKTNTRINKIINSKYDFIVFSHYLSSKHSFSNDIYFRSFLELLKKNNLSYLLVYTPATKEGTYDNLEDTKKEIFLKKKLNFKNELIIFFKIIKLIYFYLSLKKLLLKEKLVICGEALNQETFKNFRMYFQIQKLFENVNFNNLITTFEGLNLEKIIFSLSKENNCKKNIGYQHAPIIKNHTSVFEFQKTKYFPDLILTSGQFYKKLFLEKIKNKKILNYGTNKFIFKNINFIKKKNYCLVLPEAIYSECKILFNFSKLYLENFDDFKFIWRAHPMMKMDEILKNLKLNNDIMKNIEISKNEDEDYLKSKFCIFRGSSSVFNAIHYECYPVYLNFEKEFNINPLYNLREIDYVDNIKSLNKIFKKTDLNSISIIKKEILNYFKKPELDLSEIV